MGDIADCDFLLETPRTLFNKERIRLDRDHPEAPGEVVCRIIAVVHPDVVNQPLPLLTKLFCDKHTINVDGYIVYHHSREERNSNYEIKTMHYYRFKPAEPLRKDCCQPRSPANRPPAVGNSDYLLTDQKMTKEAQLKRKAVATIRRLEGLLKLIHGLATGKPGPKVRPKRKKSVTRKPRTKKRAKRPEDYDTSLWD